MLSHKVCQEFVDKIIQEIKDRLDLNQEPYEGSFLADRDYEALEEMMLKGLESLQIDSVDDEQYRNGCD